MKGKRCTRRRNPILPWAGIAHFLYITWCLLLLALCHSESSDSSEDYDDDAYNNGMWYVDDPYLQMLDDSVRQQMNQELEEERKNSSIEAMYEEQAKLDRHEIMMKCAGGFGSILGLASAIFCTAIFLYYIRVDILMGQYMNEGKVVAGRIVTSVPNIRDEMKKIDVVDEPSYRRVENNDTQTIQTHDSYSVMTDDDSYRSYYNSVSEGSGDIEGGQKSKLEEQEQQQQSNSATKPGKTTAAMEKAMIAEKKRKFLNMVFRVTVDHDDVTYVDEINQDSSETIRKQLFVTGEDIEADKRSSDLIVKLYVIKNQPLSGYPCGDVRRSQRLQKRISSNVYIMLGLALVTGGAIMAQRLVSNAMFCAYIGLLICQVPMMNCFLRGSFSKLISERYLKNGKRRPSKGSRQRIHGQEKKAVKHAKSSDFV